MSNTVHSDLFSVRFYIIYWRVGHSYDDDIRHSLKYVLSRCYIGDW